MTEITRTEWDLILRIGETEYRCANHTSTFAINRIPLASCTLAVGRDVKTLEQARVHSTADSLSMMLPATILLRPSKNWATWKHLHGDQPPFDPGFWTTANEQVVFRGYLTGIGYKKQRGKLRVSLQFIHWLSDLAFSSIFSNQSHAGNPSSYTFQSTYPKSVGAAGTAAGKPSFIGGTRFRQYLKQGDIKTDLWKALANVFCETAATDMIRLGGAGQCGGTEAPNAQALEALKRMEGDHNCAENDNKWHTKLGMGESEMGGLVADSIRRYIGQQYLNSWWATTVWDKLVLDFAPAFFFHIIPRVETAVVAPFVPGLRDPYQVSLEPEDISRVHMSSYLRRPLRGVGIYGGRELRTVATDRKSGNITDQMGIGGCFMPEPDAKGMVLFKRAPFWLTNIPAFGTRPARTSLGVAPTGGGGRQPTSSATTPIAGPLAGDDRGKTASENAIDSADIYLRMAQYLYVQEVLRGRQGTISGKLRYDIAPGSNVNFRTTAGIHQPGDQLRNEFTASIMRVSNHLDAEAAQAGTTFSIAHARSGAENESDRTSVDSHPLYKGQKYLGAPLVDEYLFE